jgi:hypothetical protein
MNRDERVRLFLDAMTEWCSRAGSLVGLFGYVVQT